MTDSLKTGEVIPADVTLWISTHWMYPVPVVLATGCLCVLGCSCFLRCPSPAAAANGNSRRKSYREHGRGPDDSEELGCAQQER